MKGKRSGEGEPVDMEKGKARLMKAVRMCLCLVIASILQLEQCVTLLCWYCDGENKKHTISFTYLIWPMEVLCLRHRVRIKNSSLIDMYLNKSQ